MYVPVLNAGLMVPLLSARPLRLALVNAAERVTVNVYVFVVTPSWAVTMVEITLVPTFSAIGPEAVPDVTAVPFTVIVELDTAVVAVILIELTA